MYASTKKSTDKMKRAFFALVEEKHYSKITVTELIGEAGVSRTTFYRHYKDIYDMYDKVCVELIEGIMFELFPSAVGETAYDLADIFVPFCERMISQRYYIGLLCGKNGNKKFFEIGSRMAVEYVESVSGMLSENELFALKFVTFSCISTFVKCVIEDTQFNRNSIIMYRKILTDAQKAGGRNE